MSGIKEIWCLPHSHLDVGYTHPQDMLLELQCDYIEQALDLCLKTADYPEEARFRWTCEANYPVLKWLKSAKKGRVELFRRLVKEGRISVAAFPMHTTPGCSALQLTQALQNLDEIRELTGSDIRTAINHDVNGQPWTMASMMLDSRVEFYVTGINIHFGGIPFPRPYAFRWEAPDGRKLTSFVGEHYSLFSQFFFTMEGSTAKMHEGVQEYVKRLEQSGWKEDFAYLTATNPPSYDNNCPDADLADLIRAYNAEGHEQKIRFVTPEMLYERVKQMGIEKLDIHRGDWTDYWNFGCASTAREVKMNRRAKNLLQKSDFLGTVCGEKDSRLDEITDRAYENTLLFDEHTWGAAASITEPDQDETYAQLNQKKEFAYKAADLSAYLVGRRMESLAGNRYQADKQDGVLVVNPTGVPVQQKLTVPSYMIGPGRTLAALRMKEYLPYEKNRKDEADYGMIQMAPFSARYIPFSELQQIDGASADGCRIEGDVLETPFYQVTLGNNGRICQIVVRKTGRELIQKDAEWGFFDIVEESIDERFAAPDRDSFFPRDVDKANRNITQWEHNWRAVREGIRRFEGFGIEQNKESITLCYRSESKSMKKIEQKVTFSSVTSVIGLDVTFTKEAVEEPEGIYFAFPLQLKQSWECVYDTADTFVRLDEEQLGTVCRDYITVDKSIAMFDEEGGVMLACPDAPMVQAGGFWFGKENRKIERMENPLLLAWPMNNYWSTNFAASQEGKISLHYEMDVFEQFDEREMYRFGVQAAAPCVIGAAIECREEKSRELVHCESETSAPVFIRPQYRQDGWMIAVKNFTKGEGKCCILVPEREILSAALTDIQGNVTEELLVGDNRIEITQKPNAITFVKVVVK